jgi:hypothetical protein
MNRILANAYLKEGRCESPGEGVRERGSTVGRIGASGREGR